MVGAWVLGVDLGTSESVGVEGSVGRAPTPLSVDGDTRVPSAVALRESGELVAGERAVQEGQRRPECSEPRPKDYVVRGLDISLFVPGPDGTLREEAVSVERALAATVELFVVEGRRFHGGDDPERLVLTCPAAWSAEQRGVLKRAAARVLPGVPAEVMDEPVAAARYCALYDPGEIEPEVGDRVAVHDLGAGTFDVAVLERTATGFEVVGRSGIEEGLGGNSFDHRVLEYVAGQLERVAPQWWSRVSSGEDGQARRDLDWVEREVRRVREALSRQDSASIYVLGADVEAVDVEVELTRAELEDRIGADVRRTVDVLKTLVSTACPAPRRLAAVFLTGGAGRTPLVERLVREAFPQARTWRDPKTVTALGATHTILEPLRAAQEDVERRERERLLGEQLKREDEERREEQRRVREEERRRRDEERRQERERLLRERREREEKARLLREQRKREEEQRKREEEQRKREEEQRKRDEERRRWIRRDKLRSSGLIAGCIVLVAAVNLFLIDLRDGSPRALDFGVFGDGLLSDEKPAPSTPARSNVAGGAQEAVLTAPDARMVELFPELRPGSPTACETNRSTWSFDVRCRGADGVSITYTKTADSANSPSSAVARRVREAAQWNGATFSRAWQRDLQYVGTIVSGRRNGVNGLLVTGKVQGEPYSFSALGSASDLQQERRLAFEDRVLARLGSP